MHIVRDGVVIKGCGSHLVDMHTKLRPTKQPKIIAECFTARFHEYSIGCEILDIVTPAYQPATPEERSISPICEDWYDIAELKNCRYCMPSLLPLK
ncbi:UNVERIFIED_CONTAM: hypothetical protein NCL1_21605 [Trichonephila clavipes]